MRKEGRKNQTPHCHIQVHTGIKEERLAVRFPCPRQHLLFLAAPEVQDTVTRVAGRSDQGGRTQ